MALNLATQTEVSGDDVGSTGTQVVKPPPAPAPSPEAIARLFPQFEIIEGLGRGGMGVVNKARPPKLDRFVGLKILLPEQQGDGPFAGSPVKCALAAGAARRLESLPGTQPGFPSAGSLGSWHGSARIVVAWCKEPQLPVAITINRDGTVTGTVGNARLRDAQVRRNRGTFDRALGLKTGSLITPSPSASSQPAEEQFNSGPSPTTTDPYRINLTLDLAQGRMDGEMRLRYCNNSTKQANSYQSKSNRKTENHENKNIPCEYHLPEDAGRAFKNRLREAAAGAARFHAARRGASPIQLHDQ
jgi:hypothetical protein